MSRVELKSVEKKFGETPVVRGVTLDVGEGEFLVLVGRSGCGKSTCLRMIAGLEEPTSGEIRIGGTLVNDVPPKDRDVGMVFQSYALYPHMTVRRNIAFGLELRKLHATEVATRVDEVAKSLELVPLLDRFPRELSGGQRQRVAIGRAIARRPKVFLFDEPLSNLDAALRVQMRAELAALHRKLGATMIYVTHDQVEAMTLATRIAVLEGGVLQQCAPPLDLYRRPANTFVAGFIGSPAMNLIDGAIADGVFRAEGLSVPLAGAPTTARASLGIRPHDLRAAPAPAAGMTSGTIEALEPTGWETFAHVRMPFGKIIVRLEGELATKVHLADVIAVGVDPAAAHLFDAEGRAIRNAELAAAQRMSRG